MNLDADEVRRSVSADPATAREVVRAMAELRSGGQVTMEYRDVDRLITWLLVVAYHANGSATPTTWPSRSFVTAACRCGERKSGHCERVGLLGPWQQGLPTSHREVGHPLWGHADDQADLVVGLGWWIHTQVPV
jgi:hypothetical protein